MTGKLIAATALIAAVISVSVVNPRNIIGRNQEPRQSPARTQAKIAPEIPLSVDHVAQNAGKYHRKVIKVEGRISSPVQMKHFRGKDYTVFKMKNSENGATMLVYLRGYHENLKKSDLLNIRGRFYEKRKYLFIKLKNVLKGRNFEVLS